jgi:TatD DNase family protein
MLHLRNGGGRSAYKDAFDILNTKYLIHNTGLRGNLHFFAGTIEEAKPFLDAGFTFSFTGVITFARSYDEIIRYLPLDRILSETDCPYVAPAPYRGTRNEPAYVVEVVKKIAEIRGEHFKNVQAQLFKNANTLFQLRF